MARVLVEPPTPLARRWGDLRLRVLSAAILAPAGLLCVWAGGAAFLTLMGVATLGVVVEWVQMWGQWKKPLPRTGSRSGGAADEDIAGANSRPPARQDPVGPAAAQRGAIPHAGGVFSFSRRLTLVFGLAYIAVAAVSLVWLRASPDVGRQDMLFLLLLVWSSDVGAYITGRGIGGAKLAPRISPGKTVSGALGGLSAAILAGVIVAIVGPRPTFVLHAAVIAGVLGIVAQAGDLLESFIKRCFGVKDSGRLIPGHGGLLDRLDALMAVAPIAVLLALAQGRGVVLWG